MGEVVTEGGGARPIGVGVIGFGWMGRVHAQAYARVRHHFPGLGLVPELVAVADEVPGRAEEAAAQFGFSTAVRDWRQLLADPRVQAVSVTAPNWLHREIGVAVAETGRHLWIEKPVGLTATTHVPWQTPHAPPVCRAPWASTTGMRPPSRWPAR